MRQDLLLRLEIQGVMDRYVDIIDNDRLEEWPDLFTEDCLYEIMPRENEDAGLPAPVMRCENRRMLRDRIVSLRNANIFAPQAYRHFLSGLAIVAQDDDGLDLTCNYLVINSNQQGQSQVYQVGRYQSRVVRNDAGWRFARKRCIFETARVQTLLALPI
ncbi:putative aromatic hydrocarbon dioxygenase small subunit [Caenibius tardaugens NBRC 16725]|uniref:Putative aromatic hydrocarbon dioxygenase small subunit n=1 Tax=Caenibius tardaugens NBRC 16725 TaxID=1219035 RepID=U2YP94_9SPHN|nr:anthranilate 1,2-dioxygenase small subunit AndAd [Caenibius tardaugens]AZI35447.1 anthranilate 1,2-dioxygenase [Caenibius tardaugens NBRC 16725]GAD50457.1 putative aromatic hydrocarbon dioxygenase small subunit [Caenibius tardaugens NBRC 16725]